MRKKIDLGKKKTVFSTLLEICWVVLGVVALAVSCVLLYQKVYLTPFWVNGQSMYPTFNKDAKKADGSLAGKKGGSSYAGATCIDYGVMDCHKIALKHIKRFDIVVTYYKSDIGQEEPSKKIKRVIGLPGETIKFTNASSGDPTNGDLYVKDGDTFTLVPQPIDNEYKCEPVNYPHGEIVLAEDEYYVLGDNRSNSQDSRNPDNGPVKYDWLVGKVVAICGSCEIINKDGKNEPTNIDFYWPRWF